MSSFPSGHVAPRRGDNRKRCSEQVAGFFAFVKAQRLARAIIAKDWRTFARVYNEPGAVDDYSGKLNRAMKVINSLEQDGAIFAH